METMGVAIEDAKGFCLAGRENMGNELQAALREKGGALVKIAKRLGVDHWWGRRSGHKTGPVLKGRPLSGKRRATRLTKLREWTGASGARVFM